MKKNLILIIFATLFVIFSPSASSDGCGSHGPGEKTECIKDSNGDCVET